MTAVVVIGRNEAEQLALALDSALCVGGPIVYVDSASTDDSLGVAGCLGVSAIALQNPPMLSAARGRNAGLAWLRENFPDIRYVMFLDGDCILHPDFARRAAAAMDADASVAVVVGHLRERSSSDSIYSRLSALEWSSGSGEICNFGNLGGIMCARVSALNAVKGFNAGMIAGEDSELGVRLALAGHRVIKLDAEMATHDNGITTFRAWWRRSVRAGHALTQRYALNGKSAVRDCRREYLSTLAWGVGLPLVVLLLVWPTGGLSLALLLGYPLLALRIMLRLHRSGRSIGDSLAGAIFGVIAKFANMAGLVKYFRNARAGRFDIIEYKGAGVGAAGRFDMRPVVRKRARHRSGRVRD